MKSPFVPLIQRGSSSPPFVEGRVRGIFKWLNSYHLQDVRYEDNMAKATKKRPLFDPPIVKRAIKDAIRKLDPRQVARNPVMFVVEIGSILTTLLHCLGHYCRQYRPLTFHGADNAVALVHGAFCQFCGSHGRRSGKSTGRYASQGED